MIRISDKLRAFGDTGVSPETQPTVEQTPTTTADGKAARRPAAHLTQGGSIPTGALPPPPPDSATIGGNTTAVVAAPATDLATRVELATALTVAGGSGTEADRAIGIAGLSKLPMPLLQLLAGIDVQLVMCRGSVTDYVTDLQGVTPAGWPPGFTWDDVPAAYLTELNRVVVATHEVGGGRALPPTGDGHSSFNVLLRTRSVSPDLPCCLVFHSSIPFRAASDWWIASTGPSPRILRWRSVTTVAISIIRSDVVSRPVISRSIQTRLLGSCFIRIFFLPKIVVESHCIRG